MTIREMASILAASGIEPDRAREEARLLAEHYAGISRARILAEPERDYDLPALTDALKRRAERYPLQYLFGEWEFMGLPFAVSEACLIPRPDTEILAEEAAAHLNGVAGGTLLDLCTGSGCIAAAVLHYTKGTTALAVELIPETAEAARRNLERLNLSGRCRVLLGDVRDDLLPEGALFDVITANPPYIAREEMETLEPELFFEPRQALTDEGDGLSLLRAIIEHYPRHLKRDGVMLLEHGWRQGEAVRSLAEQAHLLCRPLIDYAGNPRGAVLTFPE